MILASASPRRRELMERLGIPFRVIASDEPEPVDASLAPRAQVAALAERKARAVASRRQRGLVLGADTIVVRDGVLFGKPEDDVAAARMLRALSGRTHTVATGIALVDAATGSTRSSAVLTSVTFRPLSGADIASYIATGEPRDKAGGYAIQGLGARLIAGFDGCFTNVVGLPLCETARLLRYSGMDLVHAHPVCTLPNGEICPRLV